MAQQFERWELVEAAEALGLNEDAETLRQPCPEKGFERRRWTLAADRVRFRAGLDEEPAAKPAEAAFPSSFEEAMAALLQ